MVNTRRSKKAKEAAEDDAKFRKEQLQRELDQAGFHIFHCISDHGFFAWNVPQKKQQYQSVSSIKNIDDLHMDEYLDLNGRPSKLTDASEIQTPIPFLSLPPHETQNQFPHGDIDIIALHVAACHRGINLDEIDFCFGGSTLQMLATQDASDPYMVTKVPGGTILVSKKKEYVNNSSDAGFQFERLMTGQKMSDLPETISSVQHLQVLTVGNYRVLFRAETDAIHP